MQSSQAPAVHTVPAVDTVPAADTVPAIDTVLRYQPPMKTDSSTAGRPFNFSRSFLSAVGFPITEFHELSDSSVEREFVFVTAADDKFFHNAMDAISTVQQHYPQYFIYLYDLSENSKLSGYKQKVSVNLMTNTLLEWQFQ